MKALLNLITLILIGVFSVSVLSAKKTVPQNIQLEELTIEALQNGYRSGAFTITEVVTAYLQRIEELDKQGPCLGAVITVNPDALKLAGELDRNYKTNRQVAPLYGVPVIVKDNIDTHDKMPCTAGSRALAMSYPLSDSYVVKKLREAGAIILGKANLSEWANFRGELSTSGWSGLGGQTRNPYEPDRNPCGSSSGSAVAVSANLCMLAVGTETNGSIVCPSHSTGIVGIKPTVGLISRSGIIPISFTQDTPGPMARTLTDAVVMLGTLTGVDSADTKTMASDGKSLTDYTIFLKKEGMKGKRIGILNSASGINHKVDSLMSAAIRVMKQQGAEVVEIQKIFDAEVETLSFQIMLHEYKDGLNAYFASLGPNARIRNLGELIAFNRSDSVELRYFNQKYLELALKQEGTASKEYKEALAKMMVGSRENGLDRIMQEHRLDAIAAPTGSPAWKTDLINGDSFQFGSSSPAAIAGYPSITIPMGFVEYLPVGISFFGAAWSEPILIELAFGFEQATNARKAPKFISTH